MSGITRLVESMINDKPKDLPVIQIVSVKSEVVNTLNAILNKEADLYEADWDLMDFEEAERRAKEILEFSKFVNNTNNIDF